VRGSGKMQLLDRMLTPHPSPLTPLPSSLHSNPCTGRVRGSGKMQLLDRMLTTLKARGHKVLIFFQVSFTHKPETRNPKPET